MHTFVISIPPWMVPKKLTGYSTKWDWRNLKMKSRNYVSFNQALVSIICINGTSSTLCFVWVLVRPQKFCRWITWGSQSCTWTTWIWNIGGKITDSALGNSSLMLLWQSLSKTIAGDVFSTNLELLFILKRFCFCFIFFYSGHVIECGKLMCCTVLSFMDA